MIIIYIVFSSIIYISIVVAINTLVVILSLAWLKLFHYKLKCNNTDKHWYQVLPVTCQYIRMLLYPQNVITVTGDVSIIGTCVGAWLGGSECGGGCGGGCGGECGSECDGGCGGGCGGGSGGGSGRGGGGSDNLSSVMVMMVMKCRWLWWCNGGGDGDNGGDGDEGLAVVYNRSGDDGDDEWWWVVRNINVSNKDECWW